uniref:Uncharacterized protein n=1 Tax=Myotis myotis TaxID=51298 RepID=A0A7J7SRE0_MYOMY|nr:hypothetical protein mMyoMyo1_009376 [Myotis myotis]
MRRSCEELCREATTLYPVPAPLHGWPELLPGLTPTWLAALCQRSAFVIYNRETPGIQGTPEERACWSFRGHVERRTCCPLVAEMCEDVVTQLPPVLIGFGGLDHTSQKWSTRPSSRGTESASSFLQVKRNQARSSERHMNIIY